MRIKMQRDEIVAEGPQRLFAGQEYNLPDGVAQNLIESGAAVSAEPPKPQKKRRKKAKRG